MTRNKRRQVLTHVACGWACLLLAIAGVLGCSGEKPPNPAAQAGPNDKPAAQQGEHRQPASQNDPPEQIKPLQVKRLTRDPRSVLDRLEDAGVAFRRNADGNVRVIRFDTFEPSLLRDLLRLEHVQELAIQDAGESLETTTLSKVFDKVQLRSLELHGRAVTADHLAGLAGQSQLRLLRLSSTRVDDGVLQQLAELNQLERVELAWTRITDDGLQSLQGLQALKSLDLSYTGITDDGLKRLAGLKSLRTLILSGTSISESASEQLREALPDTRIIGLPSDGDLPPPPPDPNEPPPGLIAT